MGRENWFPRIISLEFLRKGMEEQGERVVGEQYTGEWWEGFRFVVTAVVSGREFK